MQQRVLPAYRVPFFEALAGVCRGGLSVFAGEPLPEESVVAALGLGQAQHWPAHNFNLFPIRSPFYRCWQAGWLRWLEEWQPDVLVLEANSRNLSSRWMARWMHSRGRPALGWGLGSPGVDGLLAPARIRERLSFLLSLDGVIAYSQRGAAEYRALGLAPERVFVAPNAVAPRPVKPPAPRATGFNRRPTILFVGRLQARKRIDNLLRACARLAPELQPRLWIVGDGPVLDDLKTLAESVYPSTEFLGPLQGQDLEPLFARADLFVLPGSGGLAVQQAMAHGLPVIVGEGDGTQEDMVTGKNGWRVPGGDVNALGEALAEALSNAGRLRSMGAESLRIVSEEVNLERMVAAFIEAVCSVYIHPSRDRSDR